MSEINTTENIDVDKESLSTIEKENWLKKFMNRLSSNKISFNFSNPFLRKEDFSIEKKSFFQFSWKISLKNWILPFLLIVILFTLVWLNIYIRKEVDKVNSENDKIYNKIIESIPQKEIEQLIKTKKEIDYYDNIKTSLNVYEIWAFLSRIIPKTNSAETVDINDAKIDIIYTDADYLSHLMLQNTLEKLKNYWLIKEYISSSVEWKTNDDLTTYYETSLNLNAGIEADVWVRKYINDKWEGLYKSVLLDKRWSTEEETIIKERTFLERIATGNDPYLIDFLKFNK
jgi:hypothetical protein